LFNLKTTTLSETTEALYNCSLQRLK